MKRRALGALLAAAAAAFATRSQGLEVSYLYNLSSPNGVVPLSGAMLSYDDRTDETFVLGEGVVRIFNASGMETYTFGDDPEVGGIYSVVSLEDTSLLSLSSQDGKPVLVRCNFRGELIDRVELKGIPAEHAGFAPSRIRYADGRIYLADLAAMKILVAQPTGEHIALYDVAAMLGAEDKRADLGIRGFNVDGRGDILFTIQPLFKAYVLSPDGKLTGFGERGSAPGKFNVLSGIAADDRGNVFVADLLRCVVLVFDRDLRFVREFGYRGWDDDNLIAPVDVAVGHGKVFVSQRARRGVSVFKIDDAAPPAG